MLSGFESPKLLPVQTNERETFMDVLRGFAILGIFIANLGSGFTWYKESAHATGPMLLPDWDHKMQYLHQMFIEGKFYSIFSLLFGWGIALQVKRGLAKGIDATPTIKRRLVFMLLLGHGWLNIIEKKGLLNQYATLGFSHPAKVAVFAGVFEITAALIVLIKPIRNILLVLLIWKISTELFYPHYELFEWIERGGSYGSILALWFALKEAPSGFSLFSLAKHKQTEHY